MTKTTKTIIGITSALFVGVAGYFIWRGIKKSKDAKQLGGQIQDLTSGGLTSQVTTTNNGQTTTTTTTTPTPPKPGDEKFIGPVQPSGTQQGKQIYIPPTLTYPIMFGQRGDNVKKLQQMLLAYDSTILPKYGADSSFGTETATALNKVLGNSIVRNEADRNTIADKVNKKLLFKVAANISMMPLGVQVFR